MQKLDFDWQSNKLMLDCRTTDLNSHKRQVITQSYSIIFITPKSAHTPYHKRSKRVWQNCGSAYDNIISFSSLPLKQKYHIIQSDDMKQPEKEKMTYPDELCN